MSTRHVRCNEEAPFDNSVKRRTLRAYTNNSDAHTHAYLPQLEPKDGVIFHHQIPRAVVAFFNSCGGGSR